MNILCFILGHIEETVYHHGREDAEYRRCRRCKLILGGGTVLPTPWSNPGDVLNILNRPVGVDRPDLQQDSFHSDGDS